MVGHAGCNRISSTYKLNGAQLSFGEVIATRMFCQDMPTETACCSDEGHRRLADFRIAVGIAGPGQTTLARFEARISRDPVKCAALPAGVWALGLVSLFMDVSSEMIHALLPVFVVGTLGAGAIWLGIIEGVAEATACIVKVFSGALSDRWGKRKSLALLGYGLAAITKPLFPLAGSAATVFVARCIDRIGKGIRGAPRDALVADYTTPEQRGAAYGLRQSLDTTGASRPAVRDRLCSCCWRTTFAPCSGSP